MAANKEFTQNWVSLAHKVLSSVLVDEAAIWSIKELIGPNSHWFPAQEGMVWKAVLQCVDENTLPTVEAVGLRLNGNNSPSYLRSLAGKYSVDDNRRLVYNAEQLRDMGIVAQLQSFGQQLSKLDKIADIPQAVEQVSTELTGIMAKRGSRQSDSEVVSDVAWKAVLEYKEVGIPTGLKWFDALVGGLWQGMNYWVAAAYKQGKSTLLRNCVLEAAKHNHPVGVFCAEGTRELFALDCQAMLATETLISQGLTGDKLRLNGLFIKRHYWNTGVFSKQELDAMSEARQIWNGLPIHIWDSKDCIRAHSTLRYLVKRGRLAHGITSYWADYSQLFGEGKIYDRQSATALLVQDIAQTENVAMCLLAQLNEEGVRGAGGYSANVKGGGDAAAAADFMFVPTIDPDEPGVLTVSLKHSRHTKTASGRHFIEPSSGLMFRT